jgi:hypothetical protein
MFCAFKQFLVFTEIVFAKKSGNKKILSYSFGSSPRARPISTPARHAQPGLTEPVGTGLKTMGTGPVQVVAGLKPL